MPIDEMVSIAFPPPHTPGFDRSPARLTAEAKVVRAIVIRNIIPRSGYREEFTLLHQWVVAAILRRQLFDLADLLIGEMEEVISERVGGRHLVYGPYICYLLRRIGLVTEEQYEALPKVTTNY